MNLDTLGTLQGDRGLIAVSGVCPTSQDFIDYVNECVRRLMKYGNWWNTIRKLRVCSYGTCVAWPSFVGTILATNVCGHNKPVKNYWYEFWPLEAGDYQCNRKWSSNASIESAGTAPVFRNIDCGQTRYVRFYPRYQADLGKTVTVYAVDPNGQTYQTRQTDGTWIDGEVLTLKLPFVSTSKPLREVTRVSKDVTQGPVDVYQYDAVNNILLDMAHYGPRDTEPGYAHSVIRQHHNLGCFSCANGLKSVVSLIKLEFQPMVLPTDLAIINDSAAVKLMLQSIKKEEAYDEEGSAKLQLLAIKELNRQLNDKIPIDQIPTEFNPFGSAVPARSGIGRMI